MRSDESRDLTVGPEALAGGKSLPAGTQLGAYRIVELLGTGAMGRVYLAEHVTLGRRVAIKLLRDEHVRNAAALTRFFAEARAVNRVQHENIVEIHDFVADEGTAYLVMELLQGIGLAEVIDFGELQPLQRTVAIARQIAAAMAVMHAAGVIHRDLKPDNIILTERNGQRDFVKLLDFGIAKLDDDEKIAVHQTAVGTILGTPEYMSPEQASGMTVDARTDIYAFGVLLYEMTTRKRPFYADSFGEMVVRHLTVEPEPPSRIPGLPHAIPSDLERLILDCLRKERRDRPQSMTEIGERLERIEQRMHLGLVLAESSGRYASVEIAPPPRRSRGWIVGLLASALTATILAIALAPTVATAPAEPLPPPPVVPVLEAPVPLPIPIIPAALVLAPPPGPAATDLAEDAASALSTVEPSSDKAKPKKKRPQRRAARPLDRNGVFDDPYSP